MITTVCKISYGSQTVPPIVPAVQGDTGRAISFEIADFTPPAGATATYFILKPSGEAIYNSATITNNSILCELTAQSLAEAGENRMQVRVLQGEDIVTSFEVILMVRTFLGDDAIESGTEMNIFDQAVEQATEQFQENAEQIVEEVIESIPADYTELTEEVEQLNERLSAYDNLRYVETLTEEMFERGSYSSGVKSEYNKNNRIRTITKYVALNDIYIRLSGTETNARVAIEYLNNDGSFASSQTWDSNATIKKGSYFDLILASSTVASATEIAVTDIFEMFTITKEDSVIVSADADSFNVLPATINRNNLFISSTTRISISDYIEIPDTFIFLAPDTGYAVYVVLYDEDFNIIDYGTKGWQTGNNFVTGGKYLRVSLAKTNSTVIGVAEIEHLKIANTYPLSVEYAKDGNIISIAKDGINNSVSDYAPKYPRSSIYSLSQAYRQGFRSLMLHVQYTTDGVGVVYHDQTINAQARNSDGTTITTTVYIRQSTIAELDQYDFGIYFGSQYAGLKILRLNDALAFCKKIGVNVIIEPTIDLSANELALLKTSIDNYNLSKNIGYVSNSVITMLNIKNTFPYAWLLMWVNDETTLTNHFNTIKSLLTENNRVYIYTYAETVYSDTALQNLADNELGLVLQIVQTGREPSNIISALTAKPYTNGFVSQIMPAYVAGQYDSLNN